VRELPGMPWLTRRVPLRPTRPEVEVLAEAGGAPVVISRRLGRGTVVTLAFDAGRQICALQQGVAGPDSLTVEDRYPNLLRPGLHSDDLVADARLLAASVPYADVFERFLLSLIEQAAPLPRWWMFPDAAVGAYFVTHDENGFGDASAWVAAAERAQQLPATWFVARSEALTPKGIEQLLVDRERVALGLSWNLQQGKEGAYRPSGLLGFTPWLWQQTLSDQADWFSKLTNRPVHFSRSFGAGWSDSWALPPEAMAAEGVRLDSSYGPTAGRGQGYLNGTGLPFTLLDSRGLPLTGLREQPFLVSWEGRKGAGETLTRLLQASAETYHQAVTVRLSPAAYREEPDVELYRLWRQGWNEAKRLGLWSADFRTWIAFLDARRTGGLTSTFDGTMMLIEARAQVDGQTLALPAQWAGRPAGPVTLDSVAASPKRLNAVGGDVLLLPLRKGTHSVVIEYMEGP
jgi:hypothetical protein